MRENKKNKKTLVLGAHFGTSCMSEQRDKVPFEIVANFQGFTNPSLEIVRLHSYLKSHILG
jgi:hypothetical protein